jgi:hypothetical protein
MTRRWDFISDSRVDFGVQLICRVLQVSRSGYYRWLAGTKARVVRRAADDALVEEIREIHTGHKGPYGVRRVHAELRGFGHTVNRKRAPSTTSRLQSSNSSASGHVDSHSQHESPCPHSGSPHAKTVPRCACTALNATLTPCWSEGRPVWPGPLSAQR